MIAQGQQREEYPKFLEHQRELAQEYIKYKLYTEKPTFILWVVFSWLVSFINVVFVMLSIRDMWNNGYSAGTHWLSSAVLVANIFGLMLIHEYIIRKKNNA